MFLFVMMLFLSGTILGIMGLVHIRREELRGKVLAWLALSFWCITAVLLFLAFVIFFHVE